MTRNEFIIKLKSKLVNFPDNEVNDRLNFYNEIIDDYMDDGMAESDAVEKLGSIEEICAAIASDIPLGKLAKKKLQGNKKLSTFEIILLIVGFPIWFSLLAAGFAVVIATYASLWAVVVSFWAVVLSCCVASFVGIIMFIIYLCTSEYLLGFVILGSSFILLGIAGLFFVLAKYLTKFAIKLPKILFSWVKKLFIIKENKDEENN